MTYFDPLTRHVRLTDGTIPDAAAVQTRRLRDLEGLFVDRAAERALMASDPLVYEVHEATDGPKEDGHLLFSTTVLKPGRVGAEYFMTKGHFHARSDRAELYYGLSGEGMLLLQTPEGRVDVQPMIPGAASYVPPHWGHRTINTGSEDFVFLAVYPADAGYDYGTIATYGFASAVVAGPDGPRVIANPHYRPPASGA
ncbi:MAG: cupin domain-containing protein [Trueperaceae bacterium]|nr:cupin domain-containing protein [Trueperaceae bacterium]